MTAGYFLVEPLLTFLNVMNWTVFKTWVTSHETALLAGMTVGVLTWATLALVIYGGLLYLDGRLRSH